MATVNPNHSDRLNMADCSSQTSLLSQSWWALILRGVLAIIVGVLSFVLPGITVAALALLLAAYFVVDGVLAIIAAVRAARARKRWWPFVLEGIAGIGVGVIALFWPGLTVLALVYIVAVWAIVTGVLEGFAGAYVDGAPRWLLVLGRVLRSARFGTPSPPTEGSRRWRRRTCFLRFVKAVLTTNGLSTPESVTVR